MPTVTPVLSEYISLNDMESTSNRIALFYIQFSPQAVRLARLRGAGCSAPGRKAFRKPFNNQYITKADFSIPNNATIVILHNIILSITSTYEPIYPYVNES